MKKRLNTSHPDCPTYTAQFRAIWDAYFEFERAEKAKYPNWRGLDHPADGVIRPVHKQCCEETKRLQERYSHLFSDISE